MTSEERDQANYQANKHKMPDALELIGTISEQLGESWVPPSWPNGDGVGEDYEMSNITYSDGWSFTFREPGKPAIRISAREET